MENNDYVYYIQVLTSNFKTMKKNECLIYSLISSFCQARKGFTMGNEELGRALKICKKTVINSINSLEDKGLITVKRGTRSRLILLNFDKTTAELFKKVYKKKQ